MVVPMMSVMMVIVGAMAGRSGAATARPALILATRSSEVLSVSIVGGRKDKADRHGYKQEEIHPTTPKLQEPVKIDKRGGAFNKHRVTKDFVLNGPVVGRVYTTPKKPPPSRQFSSNPEMRRQLEFAAEAPNNQVLTHLRR
jgi:hypothetical protein